jgi:hypothetical protein
MRLFTGSIFSLAFALSASGQPYRVATHSGVGVTMRDGVKLIADIYQPEAEGTFPVLLQRTPYNRAGGAGSAAAMAAHGYVVIVQDTRGRFDSQGEFYPFRYESQDGYDTVEWAAKLPYAERQSRHVRRLLRGRHADARGHSFPAPPGGHSALCDRIGVLRWLDVSERRADAMVRQFVVERSGGGYFAAQSERAGGPQIVGGAIAGG